MKNKHYQMPDLKIIGIEQQDVITASPSDPTLDDIYGNGDWID